VSQLILPKPIEKDVILNILLVNLQILTLGSHKGVTAKKHLGQHFLKDDTVALRIADVLSYKGYDQILEIGPGTGVLTKHIIRKGMKVTALELDSESVVYLKHSFPVEHHKIVNSAQRICASHGSKTYGILSVLAQAYYHADYLFTVGPEVFNPPPRVHSGVLLLTRKENYDQLTCSHQMLRKVVKLAFQQRRKTLRNSLKSLNLPDEMREQELFNLRPEQISVEAFVELATEIEKL